MVNKKKLAGVINKRCALQGCKEKTRNHAEGEYCDKRQATRNPNNRCPTGGCGNLSKNGILIALCHSNCGPDVGENPRTSYFDTGTPRSLSRSTRTRPEVDDIGEQIDRASKAARIEEKEIAEVEKGK